MGTAAPACSEPLQKVLSSHLSAGGVELQLLAGSSELSHTGGCKIKKGMSNSGLLQAPRAEVRSQLRYPGVEGRAWLWEAGTCPWCFRTLHKRLSAAGSSSAGWYSLDDPVPLHKKPEAVGLLPVPQRQAGLVCKRDCEDSSDFGIIPSQVFPLLSPVPVVPWSEGSSGH